jgi:asparagine synthase (glutamine-hydrolysing)
VPTYLLSKLAREDVTVSLSGDGADELFSGYRRYFIAKKMIKSLTWMPFNARRMAVHVLKPISRLPFSFSRPVQRISDILSVEGTELMYREMISHINHPEDLVLGAREPPTIFSDDTQWIDSDIAIRKMMYIDTQTYLPDDILVKVDRASMAVSLESRMPFLDHHLIEAVWRMPIDLNVKNAQGKSLLRKILARYLDPSYFDRPKMGFGVPIEAWLRGPLRDWAEDLLCEKRIRAEGYLDAGFVRRTWKDHLSGRCNRHYLLWTILMFQAWLEENKTVLIPV